MPRSFLLTTRALALGLAFSFAACGGGSDGPTPGTGGTGGAGGTGGVGGSGGNLPVDCTAPTIERIEPDSGPVGTPVQIVGSCFDAVNAAKNNKVQFNGAGAPVFGVSTDGTKLSTQVPSGATTGVVAVQSDYGKGFVRIDGPTFTVTDERPVPVLNSLSPGSATVGEGDLVVNLSGTGFVASSRVLVAGEEIASEQTSATSIRTTIPGSMLGTIRDLAFQVENAPPGGGISNASNFQVVAALNVVSAAGTTPTQVVVTFDRPVSSNSVGDKRYWTITGSGALSVTKAERSRTDGRKVVLTTSPQVRNFDYTVQASESVVASDGGKIANRRASFRAYGSDPKLVGSYGTGGCGPNQLSTPSGLTFAGGRLYVTEYTGQQVQLVELDGSFGGFLGHDGTSAGLHTDAGATALGCPNDGSNDAGAFFFPRGGVAVDTAGDRYVGDPGNNRIFRFGADGNLKGMFGGTVPLDNPVVLGFSDGKIWVANGDQKVYRFPPAGFADTPLFGAGTGAGRFNFGLADGTSPAMAVDAPRKATYITDPGHHRVQKLIESESRGWIGKDHGGFTSTTVDCLQAGTCAGTAPGSFTDPRGVVVDTVGGVWVIDETRIQRFSSEGIHLQTTVLGYEPGGLAIDDEGYLWIADQTNNKLHKYRI